MYKLIILFILTIIFACENESNISAWQITEINKINPFLENAGFVRMTDESIIFSDSSGSLSYHVIISDDKILINTETQKWIFSTDQHNKSTLVLSEMYTKNPLIIKLNKIH